MSLTAQIALLAALATLGGALIHVALAGCFRWWVLSERRSFNRPTRQAAASPKASVLMSVRGCDPSLEDNLRSLLQQDYDDYEVLVVVDHRRDPAWQVVSQVAEHNDPRGRLRFVALESPSRECSLKCSALVQAAEQVRPDCEVVALIDSDVVPHAEWLSDLVAPLGDPSIGAVTGAQWHEPTDLAVGSLLRSLWISGSIVATTIFANPWAGSCAIRYRDLIDSGLLKRWSESAVDDGPIKAALASQGMRVFFEPRLVMVNDVSCSFHEAARYVTRMLTWSRVYEKTFANTVVHAFILSALLVGAVVTAASCLVHRESLAAAAAGLMLLSAGLLNFVAYCLVRAGVNAVLSHRGQTLQPLDLPYAAKIFALLPCCQVLHALWTVRACFVKQTVWRNITYQLLPRRRVRMLAYEPYAAEGS